MSISTSLNTAVSGMSVASRMAEVVSSNVANSLTDGYGRRSLEVSSSSLSGVESGAVVRHVDRGLLASRRLADASLSGVDVLVSNMEQIEAIVGQAGQDGSIASRIVAVEAALIDAATNPSSSAALSALSDRLTGLTQGLNDASRSVQNLRVDADSSISKQVERLNTALQQVEKLNDDITYSRNTGIDPASLLDQRQLVVDTIAQIVPVRELDRDGGQIALMTPGGVSLIDGKARQFGFLHNPVIVPDMTLASGGLSGITLDGVPLAPSGVGKLGGGTLGATFQIRDAELVKAQDGLDSIAADLVMRFQNPSVDPTLSVTDAGMFTDAGAAFDVGNQNGLAGRISLNAEIDPARGGSVTKLRDGINAQAQGISGNASLLHAMSAAFAEPKVLTIGGIQQSAAGRASAFAENIGTQRLDYEAEFSFANARWSSLKEAEASDGVNTDFEMQMLLRIEQAYAANARVVQTIDSMMQRLMEI